LSFKKKLSIGNILMAIMLKFMLKSMKKNKSEFSVPPCFMMPKNPLGTRRTLFHKCPVCRHKFLLKSDKPIDQKTTIDWIRGIKEHECYADKKNRDN